MYPSSRLPLKLRQQAPPTLWSWIELEWNSAHPIYNHGEVQSAAQNYLTANAG
jgi:hypothetical protein